MEHVKPYEKLLDVPDPWLSWASWILSINKEEIEQVIILCYIKSPNWPAGDTVSSFTSTPGHHSQGDKGWFRYRSGGKCHSGSAKSLLGVTNI